MEVSVVGPLEVLRDGRIVLLPPKERVVLARLALAIGATVTDDALQEAVGPRRAPPTASKTVAGYVHRLRRALGAQAITRRPSGYGLDLDCISLDVVAIDEAVARARQAVLAGDRD